MIELYLVETLGESLYKLLEIFLFLWLLLGTAFITVYIFNEYTDFDATP